MNILKSGDSCNLGFAAGQFVHQFVVFVAIDGELHHFFAHAGEDDRVDEFERDAGTFAIAYRDAAVETGLDKAVEQTG